MLKVQFFTLKKLFGNINLTLGIKTKNLIMSGFSINNFKSKKNSSLYLIFMVEIVVDISRPRLS